MNKILNKNKIKYLREKVLQFLVQIVKNGRKCYIFVQFIIAYWINYYTFKLFFFFIILLLLFYEHETEVGSFWFNL